MSKRKVYLLIDAHARHCVLGVMSCTGIFLYSGRFATCEKELIKNIKSVDAGKKILAVEEGPFAFWIAQTLKPHLDEIIVSDPRHTPLISRNAMKRDKLDVINLCRLLRLGELKQVYPIDIDLLMGGMLLILAKVNITPDNLIISSFLKSQHKR
jgi:hypothetical protein